MTMISPAKAGGVGRNMNKREEYRERVSKILRGGIGVILAALCIGMLTAIPVSADSVSEVDRKVRGQKVNVMFSLDENDVEGTKVNLYRVAEFSKDGSYTLFDSYAEQIGSTAFDGSTEKKLEAGAQTLETYVRAGGLQPDQSGVVTGGSAAFEGIPSGLYLVTYDLPEGSKSAAPAILQSFPYEFKNGAYDTNVMISVKVTMPQVTGRYKVQKIWKGDSKDGRPESVKVDILRNGEKDQTVELNSGNNWTYSWKSYDKDSTYSVKESSVPKGYKVIITKDKNSYGITFSITNTKTEKQKVPQKTVKTGDSSRMMRWIILLCAAGLTLVILGVRSGKNRKKES